MIPFGRPETTTATTTTADSVNGMIHPTTESVSSKSFGRCADECRHASRPYALQPHPDHGCRRCGGFDFIQSVFWNGTIHTGIKYFEVICTPVALNVAPAVYYLVPGIYSYNISAQVYISTYTLLLNTAAGLSNQ